MRKTFAMCLLVASISASAEPSIIPAPSHVTAGRGAFDLRGATVSGDDAAVSYLAASGIELKRVAAHGAIEFSTDESISGDEAYRLEVTPKTVRVSASHPAGLLYGAVSLAQLIPARGTKIGATTIDDAPRFAWRGLMLDSARHYQSPAFIRRYLDAMALTKLNVLHWHLTDDQGWRLEIKKYPRLTNAPGNGAFYTQDDVRALVAYAASRGITIVPEIETPGHGNAAFAAYPELGVGPTSRERVPHDWGIYPDVWSVDEKTLAFVEDVLAEVVELFPSKAIHVGGDEVQGGAWAGSPAARARMRELGIAEPKQLQHYFTSRLGAFLAARGRRLVGWDEILAPGIDPNAIVMSWRGADGAVAASARGMDSVLAPWPALYLDNRQAIGAREPPGRTKVISLEDVYRFDAPVSDHVLGVEAAVWTEHMRTEERVAWMTFPRAAALAEAGWSTTRDWESFVRRLPALFARYEALGVAHADSVFAPSATIEYDATRKRAKVTLATQARAEIRYALGGRERRYEGPITAPVPSTLRAFAGASARTFELRAADAQRRTSRELEPCSQAIGLSLEDDAPAEGERAVFDLDLMNPCWWFRGADLDRANAVEAAVGSVPFDFQIGDDVGKIVFAKPRTREGEFEVRLDSCDGDVLARLPLAPAASSSVVTTLPRAPIDAHGRHDLCLRFAQPTLEPLYALDWVRLVEKP